MASDSQDSRRKHRRSSSSDDSPEDPKRHKHRHNRHRRHHHHHRHRHSSKKHNEDRKHEIEAESKEEVQEVRGIVPSVAADYDMEEGEIVEDEGVLVANAFIADKKVDSDVESGEFKADDMRSDADMMSPGTNHSVPAADNGWKCGKNLKSSASDVSNGSKKHGSNYHYNEPPLIERIANGDADKRSRKFESTSHTRCKSPSKGSSKQKVQHESESKQQVKLMEVDEDEYGVRKSSSSRKVRENQNKALSRSPSHSRYHSETSDRGKSASPDHMRERERSQSILYDERPRMRCVHERGEGLYDNGKAHDELDDERDSRRSTDYRFDSKDKAKDRRERSSSYHRSSIRESKDEVGDYGDRDRDREEKIYKDEKRGKEQRKRRERSERDNDQDRVLAKERDRSWGRVHEKEKESNRERGKVGESDMEWDRKRDSERRRDKDRGRSSDRDLDRERRKDNSIATYRDRDVEREWDNKLRGRDRKLEMEMERGRDRNSARRRDKSRDAESDRDRRYRRYDDRDDGYGNRDRRHGYDETDYRRDRDRKHDSEKNRGSKDDSLKENADRVNRDNYDQKNYQERVDFELAEKGEDDADRIKEQSRRLREAILKKHKAKQLQHEAMPQNAEASNEEPEERPSKNVVKDAVQENVKIKTSGQDPSAVDTSFDLGKSPSRNDTTAVEKGTGAGGLGEGTPKSERSNDIFCDDIFGDSPAGVRRTGKGDGLPVVRSGLHDNWDDPEGYYSFRFGEILDSRYEIAAAHGKGVFSTVVRAKDLKAGAGAGDPEEVAIKIIRNNETMLKAGTEELVILKKLVGADPDDRRHCVRYLSNFKYRNHLCIVFESLHMNLREVLKKFGRNIGLKLTAVRAYAKQLFIALKHLRNCGILHCDIKPDNMLVNDAKNVLKLCDFGNAMFAGKNEITPYLVSRFYRAPEIILGLPYDHPMDIWSVGCCLYELYTGKVLFPGSTNNDMLRLHMELKGPFPKKMLRKGAFIEQHFDPNLNFLAIEEDPVTKKPIRRPIVNIKPKDTGTIIKGSPGEDPKMLASFKDLLDKIFALDPEKRQTVSQALNHPFITGK